MSNNFSSSSGPDRVKRFANRLIDDRKALGVASAGFASHVVKPEGYRSVSFEDLPPDVRKQLSRDGTRGELRDLDGAKEVYEQNVPAEAKGSVEGVEAVTNDPTIHWMHKTAFSNGGSNCLLYTSPSPRDGLLSRMPSSA